MLLEGQGDRSAIHPRLEKHGNSVHTLGPSGPPCAMIGERERRGMTVSNYAIIDMEAK